MRLNGDKSVVDGLVLKSTFFGWIPSGRAMYRKIVLLSLSTMPRESEDSRVAMKEFLRSPEITLLWNLEVLGIRSADWTTANIDDTIVREFRATRRFDKDL